MENHLTVLLIISLSSCNCDRGRLSGLLIGAHEHIHNRVHDVAGALLGGLSLNAHAHGYSGHHRRPPAPAQPTRPEETIVVLVEGADQRRQPQRPHGAPQHGQYQPNQQHNPNGYNQGYNQNTGYSHNPQQYDPRPPLNYGQGSNGQNNIHNYANGNSGQQENIPSNPNQHGQSNYPNNNQNGQGNNNVNPNHDGNLNANLNLNGNVNDNYKPAETYNGQQHNDVSQAESNHKETNDKTTKKPVNDGPLLVPLNDYTYGGDKIFINPPKRDTDHKKEESEEDFPIDIRFKDE